MESLKLSHSGQRERREVGKSQGQNPGKLLGTLDEPREVAGDMRVILSWMANHPGGLKNEAFTIRQLSLTAARLS